MIGPGNYHEEVTKLRQEMKADGVVLIVLNGHKGNGAEVQVNDPGLIRQFLPRFLRAMAAEMEEEDNVTAN